ncbi:hypothetical protein CBR_g12289 [Chara braunii]|uniref:Integrase zinc-binding domain-containing protein n=1 Tax=Chara braunii TaxID=69332 RepID=A0A388KRM4_CHABU|nr:hypothetical protein CBR_g12289 [Chara braunii]|eukprot:GBG72720.1 hypothetical protein CBR_g12289 [Chara braunii]
MSHMMSHIMTYVTFLEEKIDRQQTQLGLRTITNIVKEKHHVEGKEENRREEKEDKKEVKKLMGDAIKSAGPRIKTSTNGNGPSNPPSSPSNSSHSSPSSKSPSSTTPDKTIAEPEKPKKKERVKMKLPFTFRNKKDKSLLLWIAEIQTYVFTALVEPESQVTFNTSCMGGEAKQWVLAKANAAGFDDIAKWAKTLTLKQLLAKIKDRFLDKTTTDKVFDQLTLIGQKHWTSVEALSREVDRLLQVLGLNLQDSQVLYIYSRALPEPIRGYPVAEAKSGGRGRPQKQSKVLLPGDEKRLRAETRAHNLETVREAATATERALAAAAASAVAMATFAANSTGQSLGMPPNATSSQSISSTSGAGTSQMASSQFNSPPSRTREKMELQQVERICLRLEKELRQATKREKEIRDRSVGPEGREADKAALEGLDDSTLNNNEKILKASIMSMHAYMDSKLDTIQDTLDQILNAMHRPGIRPAVLPSLPFSTMTGPYAAQSGPPPSGTSATALSQTVASSSFGPATGATPQSSPVSPAGQQFPWYPKTPLKPPPTFSGDKKDKALGTWLRTVPAWVMAKRTLVEEEVITAASYLEGSAARSLNGLTHTLESFMDLVEARWHNPQQAHIATNGLLKLDARKYKSVRELTTTVEHLIVVAGVESNPQVLLTMFLRCLRTDIKTLLASEARLECHTFETFSKKALDLEATLGSAQTPSTDGRKKKTPQGWKKKGSRLMMVDSEGNQTEIDDVSELVEGAELDGKESVEGSNLAAVVKTKAAGRGKGGQQRSQGQAANPNKIAAWVRAGLDQEVWRDRWSRVVLHKLRPSSGSRQPFLSDALKRWIEVIDQYDFKLDYVKGEYNKVADALSRRADYLGALISEFGLSEDVIQSLGEAYKEDPITMDIINKLQAKDKATSDGFVMVNGLLFLEKARFKRLVVPSKEILHSLFLGECHDATGHFGYKKTSVNLVQRFWWPNMLDDVKKYVETCQVCQRDNPRTQAPLGLLKPLPIPAGPEQSISMDFMDTLVTSKNGKRHIFVRVDRFTKYARLIAMPKTARTEHVIKLFMDNWQTVEHIKKSQEATIAFENKRRQQSTFQVGERVWVKASELGQEFGISRKLMPQYFAPWEVLDIVGNDLDGPSYVICIPGHLRTYPVSHASKLAPFAETVQFPSRRSMLPPTMDGHVDVDNILDHRDMPVPKPPGRGTPPKPAREYKVHFKHHTDPKEDRFQGRSLSRQLLRSWMIMRRN